MPLKRREGLILISDVFVELPRADCGMERVIGLGSKDVPSLPMFVALCCTDWMLDTSGLVPRPKVLLYKEVVLPN